MVEARDGFDFRQLSRERARAAVVLALSLSPQMCALGAGIEDPT